MTTAVSGAWRVHRVRQLRTFYAKAMKIAAINRFEHRAVGWLTMTGMVVESTIYLMLWRSVAVARGGAVGGMDLNEIAAYYILWTLVRSMTITFSPFRFEDRIRRGTFSAELLRPLHPIHYDVAEYAGRKFVTVVWWVPVAAVMALILHPVIHPTPLRLVVFVVSVWGGYLLRTLYMWLLGLLTFWTTRATAVFDLVFAVELLLCGRMVPIALLPGWVRDITGVLPFSWVFSFPIQSIVYPTTPAHLGLGLAMQGGWIVVCAASIAIVWPRAVRRDSAVGN